MHLSGKSDGLYRRAKITRDRENCALRRRPPVIGILFGHQPVWPPDGQRIRALAEHFPVGRYNDNLHAGRADVDT